MARFGLLAVTFTVVIATLSFREALALNCWECSSLQHQYCDSFNPDRMVDEYNLDRYVKCSNKCIKLKTRESTFKLAVVARGCIEDADISEEKCKNIPADSLVEYCEICDTDGCNSAAQYGPIALLIVSCLIKLFSIAHVH